MKISKRSRFNRLQIGSLMAVAVMGISGLPTLRAGDVEKATTGADLSSNANWVLGVAPTSTDVALFDLASPASLGFTSAQSWQGIRIAGAAPTMSFTSNTFILTLGVAGIDMSAATGSLTISNTITLGGAQSWNVGTNRILTDNAVITGAAGIVLTKSGAGSLVLGAANTFSGGLTISSGWVGISNAAGAGAGTITLAGGTLSFINAQSISNAVNITGIATLGAANLSPRMNGLFFGNGTLTASYTSRLDMGGVAGQFAGFTGIINLGASTAGFRLDAGGNAGDANLGNATVNLGTSTASIQPRNTSTQSIGILLGGPTTVLNDNQSAVAGNTATWSIGGATGNFSSTFDGMISNTDAGRTTALQHVGTGTLTLTNVNSSYLGTVDIQNGMLSISNIAGLGTTNASTVLSLGTSTTTGTLKSTIGTSSTTARPVSLNGTAVIDSSGNGGLTFSSTAGIGGAGTFARSLTLTGSSTATNTFNPVIKNFTGATSLIKDGTTTWILNSATGNSYTGGTNIINGKLILAPTSITGNGAGTGPITVSAAGTLGGVGNGGSVGPISIAGHFAPGVPSVNNGIGFMNINSLNLQNNSALDFEATSTSSLDQVLFINNGQPAANTSTLTLGATVNFNFYQPGTTAAFSPANAIYTLITDVDPTKFLGGVFSAGSTLTGGTLTNFFNSTPGILYNSTFSLVPSQTNHQTSDLTQLDDIILTVTGAATVGNWQGDGDGAWATGNPGFDNAPGSMTDTANFGNVLSVTHTVSLNNDKTVGNVIFNTTASGGTGGYIIATGAPGGKLILDNNLNPALITNNSGSNLISAPVQLNTNLNVAVNANTLTISGIISGSTKNLSLTGAGILALANTNTYNNTSVAAGATIRLDDGGFFGSGSVTNAGVVALNHTDAFTLSTLLSGAGTLSKIGTGTVTISGANITTGPTIISAGILKIGNATALGTGVGAITVNTAILDLNGFNLTTPSLSGAGTVDNSGGNAVTLTLRIPTATTSTFNGVLQNSGSPLNVMLAGSSGAANTGTLTLMGVSTYTGKTIINNTNGNFSAGQILVGVTNAIPAASEIDIFSTNSARPLTLATGVTLSSPVSIQFPVSTNNIEFIGVSLNGAATYAGNVTLLNSFGTSGQDVIPSVVRFGSGSTSSQLTVTGIISSATPAPNGSGITSSVINLSNGNIILDNASINSSTSEFVLGRSATIPTNITVLNGANITSNVTAGTEGGNIGGTSTNTNLVSVTLGLGRLDTNLGNFSINAGNTSSSLSTLLITNGGTLRTAGITKTAGSSSSLTLAGGVLEATADNPAFIANNTSLTFILGTGGGSLNLMNHNIGIPKAITGAGGLVINGPGTATLSAPAYTGATTVNSALANITGTIGDLTVNTGATIIPTGLGSIGTLTVGALNLTSNSAAGFDLSSLSGNDRINANGAFTLGSNPITVNLFDVATGLPYAKNGSFTLITDFINGVPNAAAVQAAFTVGNPSGGGLYTFGVNDTTSIFVTISGLISSGIWGVNGGGTWNLGSNWTGDLPDAPLAIAQFLDALTTGNAVVTLDGNRTVGSLLFNNTNGSYEISGSGGGSLTMNNGAGVAGIVTTGSHTISALLGSTSALSITNNANSTLTLSGGLIANSSVNMALNSGSNLAVSNGLTSAGNVTVNATTSTFSVAGGLTSSAGSVTLNSTTSAMTIAGGISSNGALSITATGGTTTISGATSAASVAYTGSSHLLTINGSLASAGALIFATGTTSLATINADISAAANTISVTGSGTLVLAGNNVFGNASTAAASTLQFGSGGATGSVGSGSITNAGTLRFNRSDSVSIGIDLNGAGTLIQAGTGKTTVTSLTNSVTGPVIVSAGTLALGTGSSLGSGALTVNGTFDVGGNNITVGALSGTGTIDNFSAGGTPVLTLAQTVASTYSGSFQNTSGTLGLLKTGASVLTLNGAGSNITADFQVNAGSITIGSNNAIGTSRVVLNTGAGTPIIINASVNFSNSIQILNGAAATENVFNLGSNGPATWSGNLTFASVAPTSNQLRLGTTQGTVTVTGTSTIPSSYNAATGGTITPIVMITRGNFIFASSGTIDSGVDVWFGRNAGSTANITFKDNSQMISRVAAGAEGLNMGGSNEATTSITTTIQDSAYFAVGRDISNNDGIGNFNLNVGASTTATNFNLNGGSIALAGFTKTSTGATIVNFNGGLIIVGATNAAFLPASTGLTVNVLAGGAKIDTKTFNATIAANLVGSVGDGGLAKFGTGTLILTGANSYTTTTINSGMLQIGSAGAAGSLGSGTVTDNATLAFNRTDAITVANAISGSGVLAQLGTGTTTLTGANGYVNTTISAGLLQIGNGTAIGTLGSGSITNNATLSFNHSDSIIVANTITGTGAITQAGAGTTILDGSDTYGNTTISAGTLQVGNNDTAGSLGAGNVVNNAALAFNRTDTVIVPNNVTGTGSLSQLGSGTVILTGANAYTSTTISAGTLQIGNGATAGTAGSTNITDNSNITFNRSDAFIVPNNIVGTGSVTQAGSGTVVLTGANAYGDTLVSNGTMQIGNNGTVGTLGTGNIVNNATLAFARSDTYTVPAPITGIGGVNQIGSGKLNVPNASYSGPTNITAGTFNLTGTMNTASAITISSGATFIAAGTVGTINNSGTLNPAGSQNVGTLTTSALTLNSASIVSFDMSLASNDLVAVTGALTLGANPVNVNLFDATTGLVYTQAGTYDLFSVAGGPPLASVSQAAFHVLNPAAGATYTWGVSSNFVTLNISFIITGNWISPVSAGWADAGVWDSSPNVPDGVNATANFGSAATSSELVSLNGVRTVGSLAFNNTAASYTLIQGTGGTLTMNNGVNIATITASGTHAINVPVIATSGASVATGINSSLTFGDTVSVTGALSLNGNGGGSLAFNAAVSAASINYTGVSDSLTMAALTSTGAMTFNTGTSSLVSLNGNISAGANSLGMSGSGTVVLAGTNTYGTTNILGGKLQVGNNGTTGTLGSGSVIDNSTLAFNRTDSLVVSNDISGTGNLIQAGTGTTILTGNNSYVGTTISAGKLQIGNNGTTGSLGTGSVLNNANLAFDRTDLIVINNDISGTGTLTQLGSGTTVLNGNNTYGPTVISAGKLQIGNFGTTGSMGTGSVLNNATLAFSRADAITIANDISGSGAINQTGSGTTTLTGNNSYGATLIADGKLQIGNGGTTGSLGTGSVINNGMLAFNRSDSLTVLGDISGSGNISQNGAGTTILTGTNTYATTFISNGTLQIGNGGTTGTLGSGAVIDNATLAFNRSDALLVNNAISGSGGISQLGSGTTTLSAANNFSGNTFIAAGALKITNSAALPATTSIDDRGVLQLGNAVSVSVPITVNTQFEFIAMPDNGNATLAGNIGIGGSAGAAYRLGHSGTGVLSLTGVSTITTGSATSIDQGNITFNAGSLSTNAVLAVGRGGSAPLNLILQNGASITASGIDTGNGQSTPTSVSVTLNDTSLINLSTFTYDLHNINAPVSNSTVNLSGGSITLAGFTKSQTGVTQTATLNLNGTKIIASQDNPNFLPAAAGLTVRIQNAGAIVDTGTGSPHALTIAAAMTPGASPALLNASFENPNTSSFTATNTTQSGGVPELANWSAHVTGGNFYGVQVNSNSGVSGNPDGSSQNLFINSTGTNIFQDIGGLSPNTTYTLTLAMAAPNSGKFGTYGGGSGPQGMFELVNGTDDTGTALATSGPIFLNTGSFIDYTITATTGSSVSGDLTVLMTQVTPDTNGSTYQANFDNVRITANTPDGGFAVLGNGSITLTGNNTYTGSTVIGANALLQIGNAGTTGTLGAGAVTLNGKLVFNRTDSLVVANTISGPGALTQAGTGTTILTGTNSYGPTTIVPGGTIQVGSGGTTGTLGTGPVTADGTLAFNRSNAMSVSNNISGNGNVTQMGSGTTTLSGTNTYTNGTTVTAGKLVIANNTALPSGGAVSLSGGGSLALSTGMNAIKMSSLTISGTPTVPTASLDLKDAGMALSYTGNGIALTSDMYKRVVAARGAVVGGVSDYSGQGITSSTAAAANQLAHFNKFGIGLINNADLASIHLNPSFTTFKGATGISPNSVLARYTYMGDINLDGVINIDDYNYIDSGFGGLLSAFSGQIIGDFNNDGVVNIDDYNIIDTGFGFQGAPLADGLSQLGAPAVGISAVPEPTSLVLLGLGAAGLLARRRRR